MFLEIKDVFLFTPMPQKEGNIFRKYVCVYCVCVFLCVSNKETFNVEFLFYIMKLLFDFTFRFFVLLDLKKKKIKI